MCVPSSIKPVNRATVLCVCECVWLRMTHHIHSSPHTPFAFIPIVSHLIACLFPSLFSTSQPHTLCTSHTFSNTLENPSPHPIHFSLSQHTFHAEPHSLAPLHSMPFFAFLSYHLLSLHILYRYLCIALSCLFSLPASSHRTFCLLDRHSSHFSPSRIPASLPHLSSLPSLFSLHPPLSLLSSLLYLHSSLSSLSSTLFCSLLSLVSLLSLSSLSFLFFPSIQAAHLCLW